MELFYLCILYLTKNISFQTNQHFYWISIASSGLSDESGGLTKRGRVMEGIFLVCIATADLRTDLEYGKSFMG